LIKKIADVKQKVAAEKGFEAAQMRLIWSGMPYALHDQSLAI